MPADLRDQLLDICGRVLAPMVEADGGELFVVAITPGEITLHLAGRCAGCPGMSLTSRFVLEPALRAIEPQLQVQVSSGFLIPAGAMRINSSSEQTALDEHTSGP
jgi:Fe-S cluster biogenesis protein NfuA